MLPPFYRIALKRLAALLIALAFCRLVFLLWNFNTLYSDTPVSLILQAFVHGLRFDLATIAFFNSPLVPLWLLPNHWLTKPWLRRLEITLFAVLNFLAIGPNFIDVEYVGFMGKRTSYDLLFLKGDVERQSIALLSTYWKLLLMLTLVMVFILWLSPRFKNIRREKISSVGFWFWRVAAIGVLMFMGRGGLQFKPLHPMHAYFSTRHEIGLLTLNTSFNLVKSRPRGKVQRERYFAHDRDPIMRLQEMTELSRPPLAIAKNWNVVVIIIESFSLEYMGAANDYPGFTPFMDELAKKAFFFPHNFANARRSIEGLPAVLCGLPALMDEPVITSDFSNNRFDCMPKTLGQKGYSTYFLHGAHNGSMHFDTFSKIAGFENFVGLNEYPKDNPEDLDPHWGVLDEPMLQYAVQTIDQAAKPVMLSVFTLSSHHPYYVPPIYKGKFGKGSLEIHESVGYTDYSVRRFFESASTKPWFNNTIFVITADHTHRSDQKKYANTIGPWRVPLLIYIPGLKAETLNVSRDRITQHVDVLPSLYDLLGVEPPDRILVGQSVFDDKKPGHAYNFITGNRFWYIDPATYIEVASPNEPVQAFSHHNTWDMQPIAADTPAALKAVGDLRAVLHYMNVGLMNNSLHSWRKSL
jgi:phosphoglycerol transferase MdoB-like AlkP superfamily enzyme